MENKCENVLRKWKEVLYLYNKIKQIGIMSTVAKLREIQNEEANNRFVNGNLWNDLQDLIYVLENPQSTLESVQAEVYGAKLLKK